METKKEKMSGFDGVLKEEHKRIKARRNLSGYEAGGDPEADAIGLSLSGGGIRSAAFNLGILQALNRCELFQYIDYLSTVSGGGYIGTSLTWFMSRLNCKAFPFDTVNRQSSEFADKVLAQFRARGKYLTPGDGLTWWALIATVLTGILVNLFVLLPIFFCTLWILSQEIPIPSFFAALPFTHSFKVDGFAALFLTGCFFIALFVLSGVCFSLTTRFDFCRRSNFQRMVNNSFGKLLIFGVLFMVIGSVPAIDGFLITHLPNWVHAAMSSISLAGIVSLCSGLLGIKKGSDVRGIRSILFSVGLSLLIYGLFLWFYYIIIQCNFPAYIYLLGLSGSVIIAFLADINHVSMHRFYRNRLMETFMPSRLRNAHNEDEIVSIPDRSVSPSKDATEKDSDLCYLAQIGQTSAPYHIINANMQTVGSRLPKLRERGGDNFIFSPLFCGAESTRYISTDRYIRGKVNLATAMAISGAAVDPNTYATRSRPLTFLMTLLNVRLGYWIRNPKGNLLGKVLWCNPFWYTIFLEMFGRGLNEKCSSIHLSDGGHFENLALYELIKRKCKYIIVSDASADPNYFFDDLGKAIERVWVDFKAEINLDTRPMHPINKEKKISREACVVGDIIYEDGKMGKLIYINTTLIAGLPESIYAYQRTNPSFPDQGTGDQFFDEQQFEAYRELGENVGVHYFEQLTSASGYQNFQMKLPQVTDVGSSDALS